MSSKRTSFTDYQQRATEFAVGNVVFPIGADSSVAGRVLAVWPAIGMVDVELSTGASRYPVEDLQRVVDGDVDPPKTDSVPGGAGSVSVDAGPDPKVASQPLGRIRRVAEAWVKQSLYWAGRDRQYRASKGELASGVFLCPKCCDEVSTLRPAVYKRESGASDKLLACSTCLFLIRRADVVGHPDNELADGVV